MVLLLVLIDIYVADTGNNRIQKFTSDGECILEFGKYGSENSEFFFPSDIEIDSNLNLYVIDQGYSSHEGGPPRFTEIQILNPFDPSEPFKNEKQGILDIRAHDIFSQDWIDLEMQVVHQDDYRQRSKFYLLASTGINSKKNKDANYDDLRPCYLLRYSCAGGFFF